MYDFSSLNLFSNLDDDTFRYVESYLAPYISVKHYSPKEVLLKSGDPVISLFAVLEGIIKMVNYFESGKEMTGNVFEKGEIFGFIEVLNDHPINSHLISQSNSTLLLIPADIYKSLVYEIPHLMYAHNQSILSFLLSHSGYVNTLKIKKMRQRICMHLLNKFDENDKEGKVKIMYSLDFFALYLNLTRSALSKELHALQNEGVILLNAQEIYIQDMEALQKNAGLL